MKTKYIPPATIKQLGYIRDIEKILEIKFTGINIREATNFISRNETQFNSYKKLILWFKK